MANKEIQEGEWIRTKDGYIGKVVKKYKESNTKCEIDSLPNIILDRERDYIRHSFNLIDLIEVGDFVNGFPVLEPIYNGNVRYGIDEGYENFRKAFGEIKSIVTKEQFKSMEYKVGEEDEY